MGTFNMSMPKNDVKVSLYFPKSLYDRFEGLRVEEGIRIGSEFSKNKFALRIIEKYIDHLEHSEAAGAPAIYNVQENIPKYMTDDERKALQKNVKDVEDLKEQIEELKKILLSMQKE